MPCFDRAPARESEPFGVFAVPAALLRHVPRLRSGGNLAIFPPLLIPIGPPELSGAWFAPWVLWAYSTGGSIRFGLFIATLGLLLAASFALLPSRERRAAMFGGLDEAIQSGIERRRRIETIEP